MVGTKRLELLTSTVSRVLNLYLQQLTWLRETAKHPQRRLTPLNRGWKLRVAFCDFLRNRWKAIAASFLPLSSRFAKPQSLPTAASVGVIARTHLSISRYEIEDGSRSGEIASVIVVFTQAVGFACHSK